MTGRKTAMDQRAQEIFGVACRLLCEMGYERASIRDLAEAVGMTKAGLYYYFKSKEELLFLILDSYMDDLLAGMEEITARIVDPEERLKAYIRFQVERYCEDTYRSKLIINDENCLSGEWFQTVKDKQRRYLSYWRATLERFGQMRGRPIDHLSAHVMLLIGMCNWIYQWYHPEGELRPPELADLIFRRFTLGLDG